MLPFFKLEIDEDQELGIDMNSLVDNPAHMKDFIAFDNKKVVRQVFNEEQMIVTGVMISEGTPIYRHDEEIGEHYVLFDRSTIKECVLRFHKNQYTKNVNLDHDPNKQTDGLFMFESYIVDSSQGVNAPAKLNQVVRDGSWIASYKIEDPEVWAKVKNGDVNGFSIEGFFNRVPITIKGQQFTKEMKGGLNKKITEMKKEFLAFADKIKTYFADEEEQVNEEMAMVTTDGGVELNYDGELAVGTALTITTEEGESMPAPEGAHVLAGELEGVTLVLDVDGVVVEIVDEREAEEEAPAEEEQAEDVKDEEMSNEDVEKALNEVAETMSKGIGAIKEKHASEIEGLKEQNTLLSNQLKEVFERLEKVEATPLKEETKKKFKRTEAKGSQPHNALLNKF
jgi:hypothetical protein